MAVIGDIAPKGSLPHASRQSRLGHCFRAGRCLLASTSLAITIAIMARVRDIRSQLVADHSAAAIAGQISARSRQVDIRLSETRQTIAQRPPLEVPDSLEADCRRVRRNFMAFARELTAGLVRIQRYSADLEEMAKAWKQI